MTWPNAYPIYDEKIDLVTEIPAEHVIKLEQELTAVQTKLGLLGWNATHAARRWVGRTPDDDLDVSARPSGWNTLVDGSTWFDLDTESYGNSAGSFTFSTAKRWFLYKSGAPTGRGVIQAGFAAGSDVFIGLRMDNSSDNYYVEAGVYCDSSGLWTTRAYIRNGPESPTIETNVNTLAYPFPMQVFLNITGTKWSNWGCNAWVSMPGAAGNILQKNVLAMASSRIWTPTRYGLTMRGAGTAVVEGFGWSV